MTATTMRRTASDNRDRVGAATIGHPADEGQDDAERVIRDILSLLESVEIED